MNSEGSDELHPRKWLLREVAFRVAVSRQKGLKGSLSVDQVINALYPEFSFLVRFYVDHMSNQALNMFRRACLKLAKDPGILRYQADQGVRGPIFETFESCTSYFQTWVMTTSWAGVRRVPAARQEAGTWFHAELGSNGQEG